MLLVVPIGDVFWSIKRFLSFRSITHLVPHLFIESSVVTIRIGRKRRWYRARPSMRVLCSGPWPSTMNEIWLCGLLMVWGISNYKEIYWNSFSGEDMLRAVALPGAQPLGFAGVSCWSCYTLPLLNCVWWTRLGLQSSNASLSLYLIIAKCMRSSILIRNLLKFITW